MSVNHDTKMEESILSGRLFGAIPALLDNLPAGFAIMQVLVDEDDNPYDLVYKYANNVYAYLEDVSLDDLMKWTWGRLFPDAGEKLLGAFANIALNGGSRVIEEIDHSRKKKTQTICYQPIYGFCACVVQEFDILDAVDVPVEALTKAEAPVPEAPTAVPDTVQMEVQQELEAAPEAEIPPLAALRETAQTKPFEESQPEEAAAPQEVIPPLAALQETASEASQPEVKPMEAEPSQPEPKPVETEEPQPEAKPMEAEPLQPEPKLVETEEPQPEAKPMEAELSQPEPKPVETEEPQPEAKPMEAEQPEPKPVETRTPQLQETSLVAEAPKPVEDAAGELAMFSDADDADMDESADDVQMIEVDDSEADEAIEIFEPVASAESADAFTVVDMSEEPETVEQDIEKGLASLERLGDVPAEAESQEEASDGASVSIMDILEGSKNQEDVQEQEAPVQTDTYGVPEQNVSIADIAAAAGQQAAPQFNLQPVENEEPGQTPQEEASQPGQVSAGVPQPEMPQVQLQEETSQSQQESAGEPGNINLEVPEVKSFGGHIAEVISDLNHLDDFSAIMKLEDLMQSAQPEQAESVTKAKQMIECSMFEEAKDLLRTLL